MTYFKHILLFLVALIFSSCASMKADMDPDWASPINADRLGYIQVMNDGDRIFIGTDKDIFLINGRNGNTVASLEEGFWQKFERTQSIDVNTGSRLRRISSGQAISDSYDIVPLQSSGIVLLLDFRYSKENITALDSETGRELWENSNYDYSYAKYSSLIDNVAGRVGRGLANALGGSHTEETEEEKRERQVNFMKKLFADVPGQNRFFMKTYNQLLLFESQSGNVMFSLPEFSGAGISDVKVLDNGDYIVLSGGRDIANLQLSSGYQLMRISENGRVVWAAEHSGRNTGDLFIANNVVLVDGGPTEAFDLSNGQKLWENDVLRYYTEHHHLLIDGDYIYFASDLEGRVGQAESSKIWKQHIRTGQIMWETESSRSQYNGITLHNDMIFAHGKEINFSSNSFLMNAHDASTGELKWATPELSGTGMQFSGIFGLSVTPPIIEGDRVYIADPNELYAFNRSTGDVIYNVSHNDHNTGVLLGLEEHGNMLIAAGRDAVTAFNKDDGELVYSTEIDRSDTVARHNNKLVLSRGGQAAQIIDMDSGNQSPVMRLKTDGRYFGTLDNAVFVDSNSRFVISVDENGTVYRHSF